MELLRGIRHLLHAEGYTIKGVQKILREQGVDPVKRFGGRASAAPAEARGRRALRRVVSRQATPFAKAARAATAGADRRQSANTRELVAVIAELEACRGILLGSPPSKRSAVPGARAPPG